MIFAPLRGHIYVIIHYSPRWFNVACQCDLHNWILTSVLWICLFIHSINCNNSESSWNLNFTLGMLVIIVSMYNHSNTRFPYISVNCHCGIYSTSLGTDSQFQTMCMIIPRLGQGCLACSWLQVGSKSFMDDCSVFFQIRESGFYFPRILAAYTTKM